MKFTIFSFSLSRSSLRPRRLIRGASSLVAATNSCVINCSPWSIRERTRFQTLWPVPSTILSLRLHTSTEGSNFLRLWICLMTVSDWRRFKELFTFLFRTQNLPQYDINDRLYGLARRDVSLSSPYRAVLLSLCKWECSRDDSFLFMNIAKVNFEKTSCRWTIFSGMKRD